MLKKIINKDYLKNHIMLVCFFIDGINKETFFCVFVFSHHATTPRHNTTPQHYTLLKDGINRHQKLTSNPTPIPNINYK
jgi:hypothetical protein